MIIVIAQNTKAFNLHFILNIVILLKLQPLLIMNVIKISCMRAENPVFLDSISFLPFKLRKLPETFGIKTYKSWYSNYLNMQTNLDYVDKITDLSY